MHSNIPDQIFQKRTPHFISFIPGSGTSALQPKMGSFKLRARVSPDLGSRPRPLVAVRPATVFYLSAGRMSGRRGARDTGEEHSEVDAKQYNPTSMEKPCLKDLFTSDLGSQLFPRTPDASSAADLANLALPHCVMSTGTSESDFLSSFSAHTATPWSPTDHLVHFCSAWRSTAVTITHRHL